MKKIPPIPLIDFERLRMIVDTAEEERTIMTAFFAQAEEIITAMEQSNHEAVSTGWDHAAHNLGGAAANLGMHTLVKKCDQAQSNPDLTLIQRSILLQEIRDEVRHIKEYANSILI